MFFKSCVTASWWKISKIFIKIINLKLLLKIINVIACPKCGGKIKHRNGQVDYKTRDVGVSSFNQGLKGNNPLNSEKEWVIEGCKTNDMSLMNPHGMEWGWCASI